MSYSASLVSGWVLYVALTGVLAYLLLRRLP